MAHIRKIKNFLRFNSYHNHGVSNVNRTLPNFSLERMSNNEKETHRIAAVVAHLRIDDCDRFRGPYRQLHRYRRYAWYAEAVKYAIDHKLFSGTSDTTFEPNATMTRGMFVTVLANMSGVNAERVEDNGVFEDVDFDAWFGPNVVWANENNIVAGTSDTTSRPPSL